MGWRLNCSLTHHYNKNLDKSNNKISKKKKYCMLHSPKFQITKMCYILSVHNDETEKQQKPKVKLKRNQEKLS